MKQRIIIISLICLFSATIGLAQEGASQNLYFVKKGKTAVFNGREYQPGKGRAFYIYRNCIYTVVLKDKRWLRIRVADIRNDSVYYSLYVSASEAASDNARLDTLALHPNQLRKLKLIADRMIGLQSNFSLRNKRYVFETADTLKGFSHDTIVSYSKDSSRSVAYELVPYLTAQGINWIYERRGITYYYEGMNPLVDEAITPRKKPLPPKKWVWFTPTNVNKISGLNLGIQTMTTAENDSLTIHGVNINADLLSMFVTVYGVIGMFNMPHPNSYPDSVNKKEINSEVTGLNISGGGIMGDMRVRGLCINGGMSSVLETTGLHITGILNTTGEFRGVEISGLCNRAIKGRGLQIGLLNFCKNLKGIQLGLWNVNSKRSLPLINWGF
ncbi:MAG: hypothetical protein J7621_12340 [Niastella sp.]|nr:hypothetical protein [Niastella sp.]